MNKVMEGKGAIVAGIILVIILGGFCWYLVNEKQEVVETLEASYTRSFYDLIEYMDNVETLLAKVQISNSSEYAAKTLTDIWRKADLAQSSLAQIPITHMTLEKVVQFLNQLSDYSYALSITGQYTDFEVPVTITDADGNVYELTFYVTTE